MVRHNPVGVGLGDWQTHYPVYRLHNRDVSFTDAFQVRRAHSDHVQFLGELGWPGLVLWLSFLVLTIVQTARHYLRNGYGLSLFVSTQLVALTLAMATDYALELPYNKFQFFLVVFLAVRSGSRSRQEGPIVGTSSDRTWWVVACLVTAAAVVNVYYFAYQAKKVYLSGKLTATYLHQMEDLGRRDNVTMTPPDTAVLNAVLGLGRELDRTPGHTKTLHKDYLALSQVALMLGRPTDAEAYAYKALELHPYYPNAMKFMGVLLRPTNSARADEWTRAYDYVMTRAEEGFRVPYPNLEREE
jgi:hypothetical protein